jgi:hypothetical protein
MEGQSCTLCPIAQPFLLGRAVLKPREKRLAFLAAIRVCALTRDAERGTKESDSITAYAAHIAQERIPNCLPCAACQFFAYLDGRAPAWPWMYERG